ncbi:hypothetical protein BRD17_06810 [Halobacteriales archaeon SW_7_68_16]|nr:MAG: hypothetical protein BRD17_06810 [Halobacteriales archaeon SW_7_68_16]
MEIDYRDAAIRALAEDRYDRAADRYTMAANAEFAGLQGSGRAALPTDRPGETPPEGYGWVGEALARYLLAAVCYRLAGAESRARNRALAGELVATDQRAVLDDPALRAACHEFAGDLRVVGDRDGAGEAYDRAIAGYEAAEVDDPGAFTARPMMQAGTDAILQLSRPDDLAWDDLHGSDPAGMMRRRVEFKRSRLPSLVAARLDAGKLFAPRGSTEYDNGTYRCPECGANDINHVASAVLCLRCNATIEEK